MLLTIDTHAEASLTIERGSGAVLRLRLDTDGGTRATVYVGGVQSERLVTDLVTILTDERSTMSPQLAAHLIYLLAPIADGQTTDVGA